MVNDSFDAYALKTLPENKTITNAVEGHRMYYFR
jgi:hypothetical protein